LTELVTKLTAPEAREADISIPPRLLKASEDSLLKALGSKADDSFSATLVAPHDRARSPMIVERLTGNDGWNSPLWRPGDAPALHPGGADRLMAAFLATNSITVCSLRSVLAHPRWRHIQQTKAAKTNDLRIICPSHGTRWGCAK
jgi:hypothetical protein